MILLHARVPVRTDRAQMPRSVDAFDASHRSAKTFTAGRNRLEPITAPPRAQIQIGDRPSMSADPAMSTCGPQPHQSQPDLR
jgi:hypothetical protein